METRLEVGAKVSRISGPDNFIRKGVIIQRDKFTSATPGTMPYYVYQVRWEDGHVSVGHLEVSLTVIP